MANESQNTQTSSGTATMSEPKLTFTASTNQISHLADVFSSITSINSQALMIITTNGISIYSEYNHICNVQLSIDPSLFGTYNLYSENSETSQGTIEELRLGVDIGLISESFSAATSSNVSKKVKSTTNNGNGASTNSSVDEIMCYITYNGEGHPLVIEFEDNLMSEKIEFLTFYLDIAYPYDSNTQDEDEDENYNLTINHSEIQFEIILKSDVFTNLLKDLQQINTIDLFMYVSNEMRQLGKNRQKVNKTQKHGPSFLDKQLNFISKGPIGHLKLIYPNEKTILEKLLIYGRDDKEKDAEMKPINTSLISCYDFGNFSKIFKAVKLSFKCKIMKDLSGVLFIQLLCKNPLLKNYSGTLITFNILETATVVDKLENSSLENESIQLNSIFDDESYEYIKDYNEKTRGKAPIPNVQPMDIEEYEDLDVEKGTAFPTLSYASFRSKLATANNLQINETIYEEENNVNDKKRKMNDEEIKKNKDKNIKRVEESIDIPLFL